MSTFVFAIVLGLLCICLIDETHSLDLFRESVPPFKNDVKSGTKSGNNDNATARIINGSNATMNEYPWMAALFNNSIFHCGGSIISDRFILTAAYCVKGLNAEDITALLGNHNLSSQSGKESELYHIEEIIMNEGYHFINNVSEIKSLVNITVQTLFDDIALLKVNRNIKFDENVSPICLSKSAEKHVGEIATVTGWGITENDKDSEILKEAQVRVIDNSECKKTVIEVNSFAVLSLEFNPSSFLCAEDVDGNALEADSGGPIVVKNKRDKWEQIGIASGLHLFFRQPEFYPRMGISSGLHSLFRQPVICTRVNKFWSWIKFYIGRSSQNNC